jgi:hypothetical protein
VDFQFVKFRRWHILRPKDYEAKTYCGELAEGKEVFDSQPSGLACAHCDKHAVRLADHAAQATPDADGILSYDPKAPQ